MAKPVLVRNTEEMMMNLDFPTYIKVAELGCSSGQNSFLAIFEIINTINVLCQHVNKNSPEIDCCLNDLPENDFNTTFKFVPFFNKELMQINTYPQSASTVQVTLHHQKYRRHDVPSSIIR